MMTEPMKTICGELGDTFIRPSDHWADRAAPIIFACFWLYWGGSFFSSIGVVQVARDSGLFAPGLWLFFVFWLIVFAFPCAMIAWSFLGATKISVSSDELVVRRCIGGETISTSDPIKLSTIKDVFIEENKFDFKGTKSHRWVLIVRLDDGGTRRVAKFTNSADANEFMRRYVR